MGRALYKNSFRKLRRRPHPLSACKFAVAGQRVAVHVVEGEFSGPSRCIANAVGSTPDATLPVLIIEYLWILHQKSQADRTHLVLELKVHVKIDRIAAPPRRSLVDPVSLHRPP